MYTSGFSAGGCSADVGSEVSVGGTSVTVLACTSIHSVGQIIVVDGKMAHTKYIEVSGENLLDSV